MEREVTGNIYLADNLEVLRTLPSESVDLIYIDPPFNTGKVQVDRAAVAQPPHRGSRTRSIRRARVRRECERFGPHGDREMARCVRFLPPCTSPALRSTGPFYRV
jgi:site-specific DNA-methyltransferase (adenine-specific)